MILTGVKIKEEVRTDKIILKPFHEKQVTTNSYDLTLNSTLLEYTEKIIDTKKKNSYKYHHISEEGFLLKKGKFILACSNEIIGSDYYVPIIHAKSGIARLGLFVHVTADLIDIGFKGRTTFQLYATQDITLYKNQKIAQVSFWKTSGNIQKYEGKFMGADLPVASQIFKDFQI